ncbi:MAG: hypothetical protein U0V87_08725 [Acidobacteriota bacterium]
MTKQRVVLDHEPNAALLRRGRGDIATMQHDPSRIDRRESSDHAQDRALAAAAGTEHHEQLAVRDLQRHVLHDRTIPNPA